MTIQHTNMSQPGLVRLLKMSTPTLNDDRLKNADVKGPKAMPRAPAATKAAE